MRLSQLARRPRHHVGAVPEPGRQSPGILDRKPHSITPGAASPTPAGRTVTRWQPTTSRRPVFPRSRSMVVAAVHVVEAESHGGCAPSVRGGRTSRPVRGRRRGFRGWSASARPPTRGSKLSAFLRAPAPTQTTPPHVWFPFGGNRRVTRNGRRRLCPRHGKGCCDRAARSGAAGGSAEAGSQGVPRTAHTLSPGEDRHHDGCHREDHGGQREGNCHRPPAPRRRPLRHVCEHVPAVIISPGPEPVVPEEAPKGFPPSRACTHCPNDGAGGADAAETARADGG